MLELNRLSSLNISRRLHIDNYNCCDLYGFCDASEKGYAAVVYFQVSTSSETNLQTFFATTSGTVRLSTAC